MSDELKLEPLPHDPHGSAADEPPISTDRRKVFFGLFVFPMVIAVTMAILLSGIVLLTREDETPEALITAIKTGAPSKRWQKAYELSNELNREGGMLRSSGIMNEIVHILNDPERYDAKTRAYMAIALGRFRNEQAHAALRAALNKVDEAEDPKLTLFLMWSLAGYQNSDDAKEIQRFLQSQHDDLRKTAAYVLGVLNDKQVIRDLERALEDQTIDVRWNAALSLARLGSNSGKEILFQMLDRNRLKSVNGLKDTEIEQVMVNAAKALNLIFDEQAENVLKPISQTDPSLKVREAALNTLSQNQKLIYE